MRPPFHDSIVRLSVRPDPVDEPAGVVAPRPRGSRRPHTDARFAAVRQLVEQSTLTYRQIAVRTGVSLGSISNWARDGGWKRPPFAPRAADTIPTPRASAKLRRRMLAQRLDALAVRHIRELEESACVDPVKLGEALELLNMARLAARRRPRRRPGELAPEEASRPIGQLCIGGVDLSRAPRAAVEDFLANREPPREEAGPRRSGRGSRRQREHAWLMEKER
jgi:transcriptional regulator with XRE-family HTH domain